MEMMEVIRTWKKFGRPQSLVDRNTKTTGMTGTTDSFDEVTHLLWKWLHHWPSQQLVIISILTCSVLPYIGSIDSNVFTMMEVSILDMLNLMVLLFPWFLILTTMVWPLWAMASLFPFKWDLLDEEQTARISKHLNMLIVLLVFSIIVISFMIPITVNSIVPFIILFFVNAYLLNATENIRNVMVRTVEEVEFEVPITASDIVRSYQG